jgi:aminobenzoyl-glutamate utilization protein B
MERVQAAARGAALGTGTTVSFSQVGGTFDLLPNDTLGRIVDANLRRVGPPVWGETERRFIEQISPSFGANADIPSTEIQTYSSGQINYGSTDVGDVSYTTPTAGFGVATWAPGTAAHSWQAVAASGSSIGVIGATTAAKVLALSAADLFQSPDAITAARAELERRRGPDFVYRSLLGDNPPSLNYRRNPGAR